MSQKLAFLKKTPPLQIIRRLVQLISFFVFPGAMALMFLGLKSLWLAVIRGTGNWGEVLLGASVFLVGLFLTAFLGRFFCGWICAFGSVGDLAFLLSSFNRKSILSIKDEFDPIVRLGKWIILLVVIVFSWTLGLKVFDNLSPWDALGYLGQIGTFWKAYWVSFILLLLIFCASLFIERFFCRYLCPLGAIWSISKFNLLKVAKPRTDCGLCTICERKCAMGLKLSQVDVIDSPECIKCLQCVSACPRKNAHLEFMGKKVDTKTTAFIATAALTAGLIGASYLSNSGLSGSNPPGSSVTEKKSTSESSQKAQLYKDGKFVGIANGYYPDLKVEVTLAADKITAVTILEQHETPRFANLALQTIPQRIISAQSTQVDTISGATRTSTGIIRAADAALSKARLK